MTNETFKGCIFDLDGVLVDTAHYHFLSWKKLAKQLGIAFDESQNEALKGVSRVESLEHILRLGNVELPADEKIKFAALKNEWYVDMISDLDESALLPGAISLLIEMKQAGLKIALGSASKNALPVLKSTGILPYFDFIADGNSTLKSKPDPAVFYIAAEGLSLFPAECLVLEDSQKGVQAAVLGGFMSLGIGEESVLSDADHVVHSLEAIDLHHIITLYSQPALT